jgi:uncharacterized repeat protein (TIGR02543 family)
MVPASSAGHSSGDVVAVAVNTGSLVKSGYAFAGWNTKADGTGTRQYERSNLTLGNENVVLYARWVPAAAGEFIANGDFALGDLNWTFQTEGGTTASATGSFSAGKASVSVIDGGSRDWDVQFYSNTMFALEEGQCYTLEFKVKGPSGRSVTALLAESGVDVDGDGNIYSGSMWHTVVCDGSTMDALRTFRAARPASSLHIVFQLGSGPGNGDNDGQSFEISGISLKKLPVQPAPQAENMILNGDFAYKDYGWTVWSDRSSGASIAPSFDGVDFDAAILDGGSENWHANISTADWLSLNANQTYVLGFECQGSINHDMNVIIQEQGTDGNHNGQNYDTYATQNVDFNGSMQAFSTAFKSRDANGRLKVIFRMGNHDAKNNDGTQVKIRNVRLRNLSAPSTMTVYVAGTCLASDNGRRAGYWRNGSWTPLPGIGAGLESTAGSVCVSGSDLYVGGACADSGGVIVPGYWKNGVWTPLPPASAGRESLVYCIQASGGKLYAAGYGQNASGVQVPLYWEDGALSVLPVVAEGHGAVAMKIAFMGSDVIVSGSGKDSGDVTGPVYWRNKTLHPLPVLDAARASQPLGVAVNGADLYFCGYSQDSGGTYVPGFWMNGSWTGLVPPVAGNAGAVNIGFSGTDRIIVGAYGGSSSVAGAWRGASWESYGFPAGMTSDTIHDSGMVVHGSDVYGGTNQYSLTGRYETGYYVNGCWVECPAPDNTRANWAYGIAVTSP